MTDTRPEIAALLDRNGYDSGLRIRITESMMEQSYRGTDVTIKGYLDRFTVNSFSKEQKRNREKALTPKTVIFNPPETIVLWEDETKTVVKCDDQDEYVPVIGLALCYMKKSLGNTSRELNKALREAEKAFDDWQEKEEEK